MISRSLLFGLSSLLICSSIAVGSAAHGSLVTAESVAFAVPDRDPEAGGPSPIHWGKGSSSNAPEATSAGSGVLRGRVTDARGLPLAGIELELREVLLFTLIPPQQVQTDADGRYEFTGLPTSAYTVSIKDERFLFETWDNKRCFSDECLAGENEDPTDIGVVDGEVTTSIDFLLDRPSSITVIDGTPGSFTETRLFDYQGNPVQSNRGRLWPGTYYVLFERSEGIDELFGNVPCPGFIDNTEELHLGEEASMCSVTDGEPIPLGEGEHHTITMSGTPGAEISAQVVAAGSGVSVPEATLEVWDPSGRFLVNTFGLRRSWVKDLPAGDYTVLIRPAYDANAGFVTQLYPGIPCPLGPPLGCDPTLGEKIRVSGQEVVELDIPVEESGILDITVVDEGHTNPITAAGVKIWDADGKVLWDDQEENYRLSFDGLPAGQYHVAAFPTGGFGSRPGLQGEFSDGRLCSPRVEGGCEPSGPPNVTVTRGEVTELTFSLSRLGKLSGTVSGDSTKLVDFWNLEGALVASVFASHNNFEIDGLAPGEYRLSTRAYQFGESDDGIDELYDGVECDGGPGVGCDLNDGDSLAIGLGQDIEGVDFNLGTGGTISGFAQLKSTNTPAASIRVGAYDPQGHLLGWATTSNTGEYSISGLSSGSYRVRAHSRNPAFFDNVYGLGSCGDCELRAETLVEVVAGQEATGIDFELESRTAVCAEPEVACLLGNRFLVEGSLTHHTSGNELEIRAMSFPGTGRAESFDSVFFESFNPGNFELATKMVDGCALPQNHPLRSFWVFIGGLTNAKSTIEIEDTVSGEVLVWHNRRGEFPKTYANTQAFACGGGTPSCFRTDGVACLLGDRFRVSGSMEDFNEPPTTFRARVMSFPEFKAVSRQAAFFEAFSEGNFELGVKMVDGCDLPSGHPWRGYWVFYGALTNTETIAAVTRLDVQATDRWTIESGNLPRSEGRISVFECE